MSSPSPEIEEQNNQKKGGRHPIRLNFGSSLFIIPNLVTVVGSFLAFLSLINTLKGDFKLAAVCIGISIIIDGLDGRIARRLNATSAFGKEFDSLSDAIAFGVAPALLSYHWGLTQNADKFGLFIAFTYMVCTAVRLARFNINTGSTPNDSFEGLPSPGAAAAIAAMVFYDPTLEINQITTFVVLAYVTCCSLLMVSKVSYPSVKTLKLADLKLPRKQQPQLLAFLAGMVALTYAYAPSMFLVFTFGYVASGPVYWLYSKTRKDVTNHPLED